MISRFAVLGAVTVFAVTTTSACDPAPTPPASPEPATAGAAIPTAPARAAGAFEGDWIAYSLKPEGRRFASCTRIARIDDKLVMTEYHHGGWQETGVELVDKGDTLEVTTEVGPTVFSISDGKVTGQYPKGDGALEMERATSEEACKRAEADHGAKPSTTAAPTATPAAP